MLRFVDCCLSVGRFLFAIGLSVFVRFIASDQRLGKNVELLGKINILRMRREREGGGVSSHNIENENRALVSCALEE